MYPTFSPANFAQRHTQDTATTQSQMERVLACGQRRAHNIAQQHSQRLMGLVSEAVAVQQQLATSALQGQLAQTSADYAVDAAQRTVLTLDVLRERANLDQAHEAAGTPPVLMYDYEVVMNGEDLPRPVNYLLLKILPPAGTEVFDTNRPYMIIDPRAGHGAGIGGFKPDSQVGVALRGGHPVYFVVFRQHPVAGQTLADVMRAEAEFLREIRRLHPDAPNPIVVGNCQGGWATLALAAANPDITGPLVINGAPVATWSGKVGESPMRYNGGLLGGVVPALLMSDLGHGEFDGAHLVSNFEQLNPSRNHIGKYFDLYSNVDKNRESFLEFEKWWGGFHFNNEAEIRWIVEELFVGNRLARGQAQLEPGRVLDLKAIRSPIIVFASHGDNITPPQQALNWIVDTYADENEIRIRGQRIVYMVHNKVGHLGIFVSASIAKKEHTEMDATLKTIEALAPGLYEMKIEHSSGEGLHEQFSVSFHERGTADIVALTGANREQEKDFAAVARLSEMGADWYEATLRPLVQSMVTPHTAEALRTLHPSRLSRRALGDQHPVMPWVKGLAEQARASRQPADASNPLRVLEKITANALMQQMDWLRDVRDASYELAFLSIYGTPYMHWLGHTHAQDRTRKDPKELRYLPEVQAMLLGLDSGGFEAAVIRMLILLAESRGSVRRDRLERSSEVLTTHAPFVGLSADKRAALIREQSIIVEFEPDQAVAGLARMLPAADERRRALEVVAYILGDLSDMEPQSRHMLQRMQEALELRAPSSAADTATPPDAVASAQNEKKLAAASSNARKSATAKV